MVSLPSTMQVHFVKMEELVLEDPSGVIACRCRGCVLSESLLTQEMTNLLSSISASGVKAAPGASEIQRAIIEMGNAVASSTRDTSAPDAALSCLVGWIGAQALSSGASFAEKYPRDTLWEAVWACPAFQAWGTGTPPGTFVSLHDLSEWTSGGGVISIGAVLSGDSTEALPSAYDGAGAGGRPAVVDIPACHCVGVAVDSRGPFHALTSAVGDATRIVGEAKASWGSQPLPGFGRCEDAVPGSDAPSRNVPSGKAPRGGAVDAQREGERTESTRDSVAVEVGDVEHWLRRDGADDESGDAANDTGDAFMEMRGRGSDGSAAVAVGRAGEKAAYDILMQEHQALGRPASLAPKWINEEEESGRWGRCVIRGAVKCRGAMYMLLSFTLSSRDLVALEMAAKSMDWIASC